MGSQPGPGGGPGRNRRRGPRSNRPPTRSRRRRQASAPRRAASITRAGPASRRSASTTAATPRTPTRRTWPGLVRPVRLGHHYREDRRAFHPVPSDADRPLIPPARRVRFWVIQTGRCCTPLGRALTGQPTNGLRLWSGPGLCGTARTPLRWPDWPVAEKNYLWVDRRSRSGNATSVDPGWGHPSGRVSVAARFGHLGSPDGRRRAAAFTSVGLLGGGLVCGAGLSAE